ncbi:MAG: hypothetical protein QOD09_493, partial [Bradyrhizobium sp.]|nr:hypothetical protein [Bradyrhizobium sp.]
MSNEETDMSTTPAIRSVKARAV